ncbi:MAG: hypothetical protein WAK26_01950, partial [Terracidiphilus sp.]
MSEFLPALFRALDAEDVRFCVLRNYEGFPHYNSGRDIDVLIHDSDLKLAIRALRSIRGIRIVGYSERRYVANVFLQGVSATQDSRAIQIDFDLRLAWKGLTYLPTEVVLQAAIPRFVGNLTVLVPSPVHESITSLLTSLIIGGSLKEKYFPQVQRTFASKRSGVIAALSPQFGARVATRLTDSVIGGDREKVHNCVSVLRTSLILHNLFRSPLRSALAVVRHYASEVAVRFSSGTLKTVCILSVADYRQKAIIEALIPILQSSAVVVEKRCSRPQLSRWRDLHTENVRADLDAEARVSGLVAMVKIALWVVREWMSQLKRGPTLQITESHTGDLIIGAEWRRYGIPKWFARLVAKLLPAPNLWVLLDQRMGGLEVESCNVPSALTQKELDICRSF